MVFEANAGKSFGSFGVDYAQTHGQPHLREDPSSQAAAPAASNGLAKLGYIFAFVTYYVTRNSGQTLSAHATELEASYHQLYDFRKEARWLHSCV